MSLRVTEKRVMLDIQREAARMGHRLFRNNVGLFDAKSGKIRTGLMLGSADLIGWFTRVIRPQDVGLTYGQFLSIECKAPGGRLSAKQLNWMQAVKEAGGVAGVCNSVSQFHETLEGALCLPDSSISTL